MSTPEGATEPRPWFFYVTCGLALALYCVVLASAATPSGGGEASISNAIQSFVAVLALWIVLAFLLSIGGFMGEMPAWAAIALVPLHVFSGVAMFVAIDMISRHMGWAMIFPVVLPILTAFYAAWARVPALRAKLSAKAASVAAFGLIFVLSATAMLAAM